MQPSLGLLSSDTRGSGFLLDSGVGVALCSVVQGNKRRKEGHGRVGKGRSESKKGGFIGQFALGGV